jgi:hypothetical protein
MKVARALHIIVKIREQKETLEEREISRISSLTEDLRNIVAVREFYGAIYTGPPISHSAFEFYGALKSPLRKLMTKRKLWDYNSLLTDFAQTLETRESGKDAKMREVEVFLRELLEAL